MDSKGHIVYYVLIQNSRGEYFYRLSFRAYTSLINDTYNENNVEKVPELLL